MVSKSDRLSLAYHDIFDFPLTKKELYVWKTGSKTKLKNLTFKVESKNKYFFRRGRGKIIETRIKREKSSEKKLRIAKKASKLIATIPNVLFVGITGALSMKNASKKSDIDFLIITKNGSLWTTRMVCYLVLFLNGYKVRKPGLKNEKDKLCLNMWLDENDLIWPVKDRNIYTAHEIAQIIPLTNKGKIHQKLLFENDWILDYWPNSISIPKGMKNRKNIPKNIDILENILFKLQYLYMKSKITREVITPTRAVFHPNNWGKKVLTRLTSFG